MSEFNPEDVVFHPEHGRGIVQHYARTDALLVEFGNGASRGVHEIADKLQHLVAINAEDHEQVEHLMSLAAHNEFVGLPSWQAALREFANPKPPEQEEPTGLGAVVEDAEGERWVRVAFFASEPWIKVGSFPKRWSELGVVRVITEGAEEE